MRASAVRIRFFFFFLFCFFFLSFLVFSIFNILFPFIENGIGVSSDLDGSRGALKRGVFFHTFLCFLV